MDIITASKARKITGEAREFASVNHPTYTERARAWVAKEILAATQKGRYNIMFKGELPRQVVDELYDKGYYNIKVMYSSNGEIMYTKVSW